MSLPDKAFPVSWDQFHRDARALAWRLADNGQEWRAMVCITRAGWFLRRSSAASSISA